ncbi:MAG TPA: SEC-C metal-binding domain-containing protein [Methanothrix sp.]|nr:SEC-C metal-binding domain-containing protein [Methanothrix sp.]
MYPNPNRARERIPVHKAQGVTPSERYLNSLCEKSFLSLWSYPGVFRDQKTGGNGDGKELCDMVVIFDQHVLIFSDKHCLFPASGDLKLNWRRWYNRAIKKSAEQAWGAERWLREHPDRVYLDRSCTKQFPLPIPSNESAKYHLIVVAHGSDERCKAKFGGTESLMLNTSLGLNGNAEDLYSTPFTVGDLDPSKTFVHVLTDYTLDILLQMLDTISDFVSYLERKENLIRSNTAVFVPGEEDLLAVYLMHMNEDGAHDFAFDGKYRGIFLEEGFWKDFCDRPERIEQLRQDSISYIWDDLIERFAHHALNATQYYTNHIELSGTEIGLRFMAREPRLARRLIAKGLIDLCTNTPDGTRRIRYYKPLSDNEPFYVFLSLPQPDFCSYEQYREARFTLLQACCMVVKYKCPEALDIVGIAFQPFRPNGGSSEDLIYLDARVWSKDLNVEAAQLQKDLSILTSETYYNVHEEEYPIPKSNKIVRMKRPPKVGRNDPCPCGSGKKYKRCHGKNT